MRLTFAPLESRVDVPADLAESLLEGRYPATIHRWARPLVALLDAAPFGLVFRIGALRRPLGESRALAVALAAVLRDALQAADAPPAMHVEIDESKDSYVVAGYQVRTLLPHHDGAHCSYLTPSQREDPDFLPEMRRFTERGITNTSRHNLYQGFFIVDPGEGLSVTTFYDKVAMVRRAYCYRTGASEPTLAEVARWLGANIRGVWEHRDREGLQYLTLGASLGSECEMFRLVPVHWAEAGFSDDQLRRFPELAQFQSGDAGSPPAERFLDALLKETLGMGWQEVRRDCELCVASERYDFVVGHNLTNLHGGLLGGPSRHLEPISLVLEESAGDAYEDWLSRSWRRHWERLPLTGRVALRTGE